MVFKLKVLEKNSIVFIHFANKSLTYDQVYKIVSNSDYANDNPYFAIELNKIIDGNKKNIFEDTYVFDNVSIVMEEA